MKINITFILAMFCIVPAMIGLINWKKIDKKLHPFLWLIFLAVITELLVKIAIAYKSRLLMTTVYNLYIPVNFFLYLLFFKRIELINKHTQIRLLVLSLFVWIGCLLYLHTWMVVYFFSQTINAIVLSLIAVKMLSNQIIGTNIKVLQNPLFLIAIGVLVQYLFFILVSTIMLLGANYIELRSTIYRIYEYLNAASYLIFTYAILCQPKIKTYTL